MYFHIRKITTLYTYISNITSFLWRRQQTNVQCKLVQQTTLFTKIQFDDYNFVHICPKKS